MRYPKRENGFRQYQPKKNRWSKKRRKLKKYHIARQDLSNPFKKAGKKRSQFKLAKKLLLSSFIIFWFLLLLYLPFFKITKISYSGFNFITENELMTAVENNYLERSNVIPERNFFVLRKSFLEKFLLDNFSVKHATVVKKFPNSINIHITEKLSALIFDNGSKYTLLDKQGNELKILTEVDATEFVLKEIELTPLPEAQLLAVASTTKKSTEIVSPSSTLRHIPNFQRISAEFGSYPIVYVDKQNNGEQSTLPAEIIEKIITATNIIEGADNLKINYYEFRKGEGMLIGETGAGWQLVLSSQNDISAQIQNALQVLEKNSPTKYLDLRFGERIYWK